MAKTLAYGMLAPQSVSSGGGRRKQALKTAALGSGMKRPAAWHVALGMASRHGAGASLWPNVE